MNKFRRFFLVSFISSLFLLSFINSIGNTKVKFQNKKKLKKRKYKDLIWYLDMNDK